MNYLKITFLLICVAFSSLSFTVPSTGIIGEWVGTDHTGKTAGFIFDKTLHVVMIMNGQTMDGHEHTMNGHKVEVRYEINEDKKPMWLDFTFYTDGVKNDNQTSKGIFKYLSADKIELRLDFSSTTRFDKFDANDKENTIILTKK